MTRSRLGVVIGAAAGLVAALLLGAVMSEPRLGLVAAPGAVGLGGLLGWSCGRMGRARPVAAALLGVACAIANGPLSGLVNGVLGNPAHLQVGGGGSLAQAIAIGGVGLAFVWWLVLPIGALAGLLASLATRPRRGRHAAR